MALAALQLLLLLLLLSGQALEKALEALRSEFAQWLFPDEDSDGVFEGFSVGAFDLAEHVRLCLQVGHRFLFSAVLVETLLGKDHVMLEEQLDRLLNRHLYSLRIFLHVSTTLCQ